MHVHKSVLIVGALAILVLVAALSFLTGQASQPKAEAIPSTPSVSETPKQVAPSVEKLVVGEGSVSVAPKRHLPDGYRWGRCLLVVRGETRISGKCSYRLSKGGDFYIAGSRQVYGGVDYPEAKFQTEEQSTDFWANVFQDGEGWSGYGNDDVRSTHGDGPSWLLKRDGACLTGDDVRVCLWKA